MRSGTACALVVVLGAPLALGCSSGHEVRGDGHEVVAELASVRFREASIRFDTTTGTLDLRLVDLHTPDGVDAALLRRHFAAASFTVGRYPLMHAFETVSESLVETTGRLDGEIQRRTRFVDKPSYLKGITANLFGTRTRVEQTATEIDLYLPAATIEVVTTPGEVLRSGEHAVVRWPAGTTRFELTLAAAPSPAAIDDRG